MKTFLSISEGGLLSLYIPDVLGNYLTFVNGALILTDLTEEQLDADPYCKPYDMSAALTAHSSAQTSGSPLIIDEEDVLGLFSEGGAWTIAQQGPIFGVLNMSISPFEGDKSFKMVGFAFAGSARDFIEEAQKRFQ